MRVVSPTLCSSPWGSGIRWRSLQNICCWRPVELECRSSTELGETETPLLEVTHKALHALGPRAKQWLHRSLGQTYLHFLEGLLTYEEWSWLTVGARALVVEAPGNIHWCGLSWRTPFWHEIWPHATACRLQYETTMLRPNNQQGGNTAPSISRQVA